MQAVGMGFLRLRFILNDDDNDNDDGGRRRQLTVWGTDAIASTLSLRHLKEEKIRLTETLYRPLS